MIFQNFRTGIKNWLYYFTTVFAGVYLHEIGHCAVAWVNGKRAVPTPAKEYLLDAVSSNTQLYISLGGVLGTVMFSLIIFFLFTKSPLTFPQPVFAASMALPGLYSFLFFLKGRGHDATEFQEAQAAMGLSYSGHAIDYIFLGLFLTGVVLWVRLSKPSIKMLPQLLLAFVITIVFIAGLQTINNRIFDPLFIH
jgi:formate hydrogenlyase subunit 4